MKWLMLSLVLLSHLSMARPLETLSITLQDQSGGPSCGLLRHREIEREKVLREVHHILFSKNGRDFKDFVLRNELISNKFFLDKEFWSDESVLVSLELKIPEQMAEEVLRVGKNQIFLSVNGTGVTWQGLAAQFPDDFEIHADLDRRVLKVSYKIYKSNLCFEEMVSTEVSWYSELEFHQMGRMDLSIAEEIIGLWWGR